MTIASPAREGARDATVRGYVDQCARGEYLRLAFVCFLVSYTSAHTTLLAVVFQRDGYDLHAIGLLLSLVALPIIACALLSGEIMGRLGALNTLRLAMTLVLVGFGSLLVTRGAFVAALLSRTVQGVGLGIFLAASYTYVQSRLSPARFLFLLGVFSATMPLATGVAPPLGGVVLQRWGEPAFFFAAVLPGLAGLALTFGLRPLPPPSRRSGLQLAAGLRPGVWEPLLAVCVNGTLMGFCGTYLAAALFARGIPLAAFFTASLVTMFTSRLLALRSIENANRRHLIGGGFASMGLGMFAVASSGTVIWPVVLGGVAFGFGYSLTYPVISAWISEGQDASDRAGSQALLNAAFNIGLYAVPLLETWQISLVGYEGTMLTLAGAGWATSALLLLRARRRS